MVFQITAERLILWSRKRGRAAHHDQGMALVSPMIGRVDMGIGILHKAAPLIESLAALRDTIYWWVNLQNQRLSLFCQQIQKALSIPMATQLRKNTKVLNIETMFQLPI